MSRTRLGKQAKIITHEQAQKCLEHIQKHSQFQNRDTVMFLLSYRAGLRAKEIANLKWEHVTCPDGNVSDNISLPDCISKGKYSGRVIPLHKELKHALIVRLDSLRRESDLSQVSKHPHNNKPTLEQNLLNTYIIPSSRSRTGLERMEPNSIVCWFKQLYNEVGLNGCSSHSGRRSFITNFARAVVTTGGSMRDAQAVAGHSSLDMTQRYVEVNTEAQQKAMDLI